MLESLAPAAFEAMAVSEYNRIRTIEGKALEGLLVTHPLFDRNVPVILADYIEDDSGTGFVHIAPGHGLEDFIVGRKHGLEVASPVDGEGRFNSQAGEFDGLGFAAGERAILDTMSRRGSLASLGEVEHEYPHCWRCASPLITRATEQWFVKMDHREKPRA